MLTLLPLFPLPSTPPGFFRKVYSILEFTDYDFHLLVWCRYTMKQRVQRSGKTQKARLTYLLLALELAEPLQEQADSLKSKIQTLRYQ